MDYIFQIKYTAAILSNCTRKLLWFEISKMMIAVRKKITVSFIIIFGTISFPIDGDDERHPRATLRSKPTSLRVNDGVVKPKKLPL